MLPSLHVATAIGRRVALPSPAEPRPRATGKRSRHVLRRAAAPPSVPCPRQHGHVIIALTQLGTRQRRQPGRSAHGGAGRGPSGQQAARPGPIGRTSDHGSINSLQRDSDRYRAPARRRRPSRHRRAGRRRCACQPAIGEPARRRHRHRRRRHRRRHAELFVDYSWTIEAAPAAGGSASCCSRNAAITARRPARHRRARRCARQRRCRPRRRAYIYAAHRVDQLGEVFEVDFDDVVDRDVEPIA